MLQPSSSLHGVVLVLLAAMLWGTTGTAQSFAPLTLSPYWVGALRMAMAAVFFIVLHQIVRTRSMHTSAALHWPRMLLGALCMAVYNLAFFAGLQHTGVGLGTAIAIGSSPIWAGLLQAVMQRRLPPPLWWLGTCIGVVGGFMMMLGKSGAMAHSAVGVLLCLLAGFSYGAYAVISQPLFMQSGVTRANAWVFTCAALLSLPMALWLGGGAPHTSAQGWAVVGYLGVVATGVSYLLFSIGLRTVSAATSVALSKFEPITAFALSIWIVGEQPGWPAFAGLLMVLLGLWLVVHSEMRKH